MQNRREKQVVAYLKKMSFVPPENRRVALSVLAGIKSYAKQELHWAKIYCVVHTRFGSIE